MSNVEYAHDIDGSIITPEKRTQKLKEQMTAKEFLRKKNKENKVYGMIGGSSPLEQSITNAMNEYALHIAEKAVEEYQKESLTGKWLSESMTCNSILSRIKDLTK